MLKRYRSFLALGILICVLLSGCVNSPKFKQENTNENTTENSTQNTTQNTTNTSSTKDSNTVEKTPGLVLSDAEITQIKPNEAGKIMVVMFHNFVEAFTKAKGGEYTTTFAEFKTLLQTLYDKDYRLISLNDYLNNNITVPAGYIPMVFTFDDGTAGQFNFIEENGKLIANQQSAVGIMEEFNKAHPDFGLKGTFYVNLGDKTFDGSGTLAERLKYLIDKGFEIGNHTYTHIHLPDAKSADEIQKEIGGNQKKMYELIPGYKMNTFSLPYGQAATGLKAFVEKGEYEGVKYEPAAIVEVGWDPTISPINRKFNPLATHRVRASGIKPVDADLGWWLDKLTRNEQFVSDGNPDIITVPKAGEALVDRDRLNGKTLKVY